MLAEVQTLAMSTPPTSRSRTRALVPLLALLPCLQGCFGMLLPLPGSPGPTVDGPERAEVLSGTTGTIVAIDSVESCRLQIISLPGLETEYFDLREPPVSLSGPDEEGRLAVLSRGWNSYSVSVVSLRDGSRERILNRRGWLHASSKVALSPAGGKLALVSSLDRGGYDFTPWALEVIDLASGKSTAIPGSLEQMGVLWLPDSKRIAIIEREPEDETSHTSLLDLETGERRVLCEGRVRGVTRDGLHLFVGTEDDLRRIEVATGRTEDQTISLPGIHDWDPGSTWFLLGEAAPGKVLYEAMPTTGTRQKLVFGWRHGSMWTVKLADIDSSEFITAVPYVWGEASYGCWQATRGPGASSTSSSR
jgi:hypothetical protein